MINKKPSNRINLSNYLLLLPSIMLLVLITGISKAEFAGKAVVEAITHLPEVSSLPQMLTDNSQAAQSFENGPANVIGLNTLVEERRNTLQVSTLDTNKKVITTRKSPTNIIWGSSVQIDTTADSQPLYILNGKRMTKGIGKLDPDSIATINVHKGDGAIKEYGAEAKNGVIEIRTKSTNNGQSSNDLKPITVVGYGRNQNQNISLGDIDKELIILDGKEISKVELDQVKVSSIGTIDIYKGSSAETKYGAKAKNGVVVITTKK